MDIFKLTTEEREKMAGAYLHVSYCFGVDPLEASAKQQRKMRSHIGNYYVESAHRGSQELRSLFAKETDNRTFFETLRACVEWVNQQAAEADAKLTRDLAGFGEAETAAIRKLLKLSSLPAWSVSGADVRVVVDDTTAFRQILVLKNVDAVPAWEEGLFCQKLGFKLTEDGRFCFYGEMETFDEEPQTENSFDDVLVPFAVTFDGVSAEVEVYNACANLSYWDDPWDFLRAAVSGIVIKDVLPGAYCNEKERALLPLMRELVALEYWMDEENFGTSCLPFSQLKAAVSRYGFTKAYALLEKLETHKPRSDAYDKIVRKLRMVLRKKSCEPLWREIYNAVAVSQEGYPNRVEVLCDVAVLADARQSVQSRMEANGYHGTYPDFVKEGAVKGIHLERSYDLTYFVGMEKRVRHYVHCFETLDDGRRLMIQFLCGTAFLKKNEPETDVYGCLFEAKGRRLFHTVYHEVALREDEDLRSDDWDTSVSIAVKKAECKPLTKEEKRVYYGGALPGWKEFIALYLLAGGFFSVIMTAVMMLFCIAVTAAFGLASDIPEMMREMPWLELFVFAWVAFGGAMGITEILALRK